MEEKGSRDLRETREQIVKCFENISCFMLPHPGLSVTRKTYDGAITGGKVLRIKEESEKKKIKTMDTGCSYSFSSLHILARWRFYIISPSNSVYHSHHIHTLSHTPALPPSHCTCITCTYLHQGLEPEFRDMLDRYMRRVFGVHLEPKRIHGRQLTAPELMTYIKTYVALFQVGTTMLY